jgi:hypothetical protein
LDADEVKDDEEIDATYAFGEYGLLDQRYA